MAGVPFHNRISIDPPIMSGYMMQPNSASSIRPKDGDIERARAFIRTFMNMYFEKYG